MHLLVGGDQLTDARARTCRCLRTSYDDPKFSLQSLIPVAEDWHAIMYLLKVSAGIIFISHSVTLQVIWKRLFNKKSLREKGTLYQLKNVLNLPDKNMKSCEDFSYVHLL